MFTADVVKHFKTKTAAADAIGVTRGAVTNWGDVVPESSAWRIERATKGKLRVDVDFYRKDRDARKQSLALKDPHADTVAAKHVARKGQS